MSGKIISFLEYCKLRFDYFMNGTRAECVLGKIEKPETEEYVINGVRYIVSTKHSETESMTFIDKIKRYLGSDFAQLSNTVVINPIERICVCVTAGKEGACSQITQVLLLSIVVSPVMTVRTVRATQ